MEKKVIRAALLGFGTVGTGVYKVLEKQKEEMIPKLGSQLEISKILVRNLQKAASKVENPEILTNNWDEIVKDPEIDIVIELIGGIEPARTYILDASKCRQTCSNSQQRPDCSSWKRTSRCSRSKPCGFPV